MLGIVEHPPPENIRRGLMFLSKVEKQKIQTIIAKIGRIVED